MGTVPMGTGETSRMAWRMASMLPPVFLIHHLLPGSVLLVLSLLFGTFWDLLRRVLIGTS
jgi:hypothetical protein